MTTFAFIVALRFAELTCAPPAEVAWALAADAGDPEPDAAYEDAISECIHNLKD